MAALTVGIALRALDDARHCGDQAAAWSDEEGGRHLVCLADGLGHGRDAEAAAREAIAFIGHHRDLAPEALFRRCDEAIRGSRGAAVGLAFVDERAASLTFGGIGNIRAAVFGDTEVRLASNPGIVGGGFRHLTLDTVPFGPGTVAVLWSDGLAPLLALRRCPPDLLDDPPALARHLLETERHGRDDAGVVAFRHDGSVVASRHGAGTAQP